jgi:hypothetical protein
VGQVLLTTNVDMFNYKGRIGKIAEVMGNHGLEIFGLARNYPNRHQLSLADDAPQAVVSKNLAKDLAGELRKYGFERLQFHYPIEKSIMDMNGQDLGLTLEFCNIILEESRAKSMTITYHNVYRYSPFSNAFSLERVLILNLLEANSRLASKIAEDYRSRCQLTVENNSAVSIGFGEQNREGVIYNTADLVPGDYVGRWGLSGNTFDYAHAWTVVNSDRDHKNIEWTKVGSEIPDTLEDFVQQVSGSMRWMHLCDEVDPLKHTGSHIGDGKIDFVECAYILSDFIPDGTIATIEVCDGHTEDGFRRILEHDYPLLKLLLTY